MKSTIIACILGLSLSGWCGAQDKSTTTREILRFQKTAEQPTDLGVVTNDGVMGGLSKGTLARAEDGTAHFHGNLSLQNNGGFSSWEISQGKWDASGWDGVQLEVLGDGREYKVRLGTTARYRFSRVAFQAPFPTKEGEWTTVQIPFKTLKPSWRGQVLDAKFDPADLRQLGIILADKKEAPFSLHLRSLSFYRK